ncbi:dactylin [Anaeramoeba flamelloides]|uniref:Dactylin n=1 Tax=Anaeramoeba flamelloides TaxID=1746091 RepID=A0AAV7ZFJ7_9EUKA|nr:dactylin [Anaeramoeba flamelloides]
MLEEEKPFLESSEEIIELNAHDIEKELMWNKYIFTNDLYTVIPFDYLHHYSCGEITQPPANTTVPPTDGRTNLLDLPVEIILIIFEYLPPIKLGICNLVCRTFNEIISEPELWRVICYNYDELFIWDKVSVGPRIQGSRIIIGNIMNIGNRNIKSARIQINSPLLCPSPYGGLRNFGMINGPTTNHTIRKSLIEEINDPCFEIKVKFEALKNVSTKKQKKEHEDDLIQYKTLSESKYFQSIESYLKPPLQIIPIALLLLTTSYTMTSFPTLSIEEKNFCS